MADERPINELHEETIKAAGPPTAKKVDNVPENKEKPRPVAVTQAQVGMLKSQVEACAKEIDVELALNRLQARIDGIAKDIDADYPESTMRVTYGRGGQLVELDGV